MGIRRGRKINDGVGEERRGVEGKDFCERGKHYTQERKRGREEEKKRGREGKRSRGKKMDVWRLKK